MEAERCALQHGALIHGAADALPCEGFVDALTALVPRSAKSFLHQVA